MEHNLSTINWGEIKKKIASNIQNDYIPIRLRSLQEAIDLFIDVINYPVNEKTLNGLPHLMSTALQRLYIDHIDIDSHFLHVAHIEKFLKKILYFINISQYNSIISEKKGLSDVLSALSLKLNYITTGSCSNVQNNDYYIKYLKKSYNIRNDECHLCSLRGESYLYDELKNALLVYLYTIDRYSPILKRKIYQTHVDESSKNEYLKSIISEFKMWNSRFVPIEGKEQFQEIPIYAIEINLNDEKEKDLREGEVEKLREILINDKQNQMIIQGEAGMGKTTTMKYMAYRDALSKKFPIYVELKNLLPDESLMTVLRRKTDLVSKDFEKLMNTTDTCVFLDGLNEILPSIKEKVYREIKIIIEKYSNAFFLLSTRPQDYQNELGNIPIFSLQKMDIAKIREFLNKNTTNTSVRQIIIDAIEENKNWLRILGTPLLLYMLIQVVSREGHLPDDENKIIIRFINGLYDREKQKDLSFDKKYYHAVFCHLAFECIDQIGNTNTGFTFSKAKELLTPKTIISDEKLIALLQKGVELTILVFDDNLYSFSHQSYQDTLAGDYFNTMFA